MIHRISIHWKHKHWFIYSHQTIFLPNIHFIYLYCKVRNPETLEWKEFRLLDKRLQKIINMLKINIENLNEFTICVFKIWFPCFLFSFILERTDTQFQILRLLIILYILQIQHSNFASRLSLIFFMLTIWELWCQFILTFHQSYIKILNRTIFL